MAQSAFVAHGGVRQAVAVVLHANLPQLVPVTAPQLPTLSHLAAGVAMPATQVAAPHSVETPAATHWVESTPLHV